MTSRSIALTKFTNVMGLNNLWGFGNDKTCQHNLVCDKICKKCHPGIQLCMHILHTKWPVAKYLPFHDNDQFKTTNMIIQNISTLSTTQNCPMTNQFLFPILFYPFIIVHHLTHLVLLVVVVVVVVGGGGTGSVPLFTLSKVTIPGLRHTHHDHHVSWLLLVVLDFFIQIHVMVIIMIMNLARPDKSWGMEGEAILGIHLYYLWIQVSTQSSFHVNCYVHRKYQKIVQSLINNYKVQCKKGACLSQIFWWWIFVSNWYW